jgi:transcriptional regulator GlxA family with amidase domain
MGEGSRRPSERRFREQFRTTPKAWIMRERMNFAPPLLAEGFSNNKSLCP